MNPRVLLWLVPVAVAVAVGMVFQRERQRLRVIERELRTARIEGAVVAGVAAENEQLRRQIPSAERLTAMRADHAALQRLRNELTTLRAAVPAAGSQAPAVPATLAECRNAGRSSPSSALQTSLWAARTGDVAAFAEGLTFDPNDRPLIEAFFAALPQPLQQRYGTPERFVAAFTLRDMNYSGVSVTRQEQTDDATVALGVTLTSDRLASGAVRARSMALSLRHEQGAWRLVVPVSAVQAYANALATSGDGK